eukprot:7018667-Prymnesium_polylepis.1
MPDGRCDVRQLSALPTPSGVGALGAERDGPMECDEYDSAHRDVVGGALDDQPCGCSAVDVGD